MSDVIIKEGFLCPICMQDLGSVVNLQQHFEENHVGEDKDVLNQLKDFFDKAKRKLLKKEKDNDVFSAFSGEATSPVSDAGTTNASGIDPTMWEPQELGTTRSYTDALKRVREASIDHFVIETNKLLIRLDKLINPDAPTDANKRKAYEKSVVPWAADSDVNLCTACGKNFTLTRRRHHCRLCGGIICNKCSQFLPFTYAKKLTDPAFRYEGEGFRRSSSNTSLNSILSPEGEQHIRTCEQCRVLLERRDQQIEQRNYKPPIVHIYQRLRTYIEETDKVVPRFLEMTDSLLSGETTYNLREVQEERTKILKLFENIDLLSKRIYTLGSNETDPQSPTALRLQKMIRSHATNYLQQNSMGLQVLPTEAELVKLQEQKRKEAQQRIEEERRLAAEREKQRAEEQRQPQQLGAEQKRKRKERVNNPRAQKPVTSAHGWKPQEMKADSCDDPMIQQMNIIRSYVKQARQAGKWDEVQMLEENLKELQVEYWKQQDQHQKDSSPDTDTQSDSTSFDSSNPFSTHSSNPSSRQHSPTKSNTSPSKESSPPKLESPSRSSPSRSVLPKASTVPKAGSPVKHTSAMKSSDSLDGRNPFSDSSSADAFDEDPNNPFSSNYTASNTNSLNPFS